MDNSEKILNQFAARIRQLLMQYATLKKENNDLYEELESRDNKIAQLEAQLAQSKRDYESLKMARMIEVTDGDIEITHKRINRLLNDVNKCITLLSEQ